MIESARQPSCRPLRGYAIFALVIYRVVGFSVAQATLPLPLDTEVLFNTERCASNRTVECYTSLVAPAQPNDDSSDSHAWCSNVYFGTHHKTGTFLSSDFGRVWCGPDYDLTTTDDHIRPSSYTNDRKIAHFIRDPLEMVVSSYQYHLVSTESWLTKTGHQAKLRNATLYDGLELEYARTANYDIKQMIDFHSYMQIGNKRTNDVFTIRLEHVRDEFNFRVIEASLKRWFGANADDMTTWEELTKCCFISPERRQKGAEHVSKVGEKAAMRKIVMERHGEEIRHFRRQLGFPLVGMEKEGSGEGITHADAFSKNALFSRTLYLVLVLGATFIFALKRFTKNGRDTRGTLYE